MTEPIRTVHLYPKFREQDALSYALRTSVLGLGAGTFSACMKNAYFSTTASAWGVLTIYGGTIPIYGINWHMGVWTDGRGCIRNLWIRKDVDGKFPKEERCME